MDRLTKRASETLEVNSRSENPNDVLNGPGYYSGRPCVVTGCDKPAGTAWGPHWCQQHNAERLNRIRSSLEKLAASPRSDGEGE